MEPLEIAIIGGGPGGLMTAYRLEQRLDGVAEVAMSQDDEVRAVLDFSQRA